MLSVRQVLSFNDFKSQDGVVSDCSDFVDMLGLGAVGFLELLCDVVVLLLQLDDVLF